MKLQTAITTLIATLFVFLLQTSLARAENMRLAVTTSFQNSGLSDVLLPLFKQDTGLDVQLIVVGTGQALRLGAAGDVDAVLVHSRKAEEKFVAQGNGTHRRQIMYNDFVLVGPQDDPAKVSQASTAVQGLSRIARQQSAFVSRGDKSGTHSKEQELWRLSGITDFSGPWYRSVGAGMGAALNAASGMNAYLISDRASWLKFGNKGQLKLLFSGDPILVNQYSYLPVNAKKHPHVNYQAAEKLENWLAGDRGQSSIADYKLNGQTLFTPNARKK